MGRGGSRRRSVVPRLPPHAPALTPPGPRAPPPTYSWHDIGRPAVAYDGSAAGLSADGTTLVLLAPRQGFPRKATTFALLDAGNLVERSRLTLRGDFSFDAMSPDGRWLYLIQYTSPDDPLQYRVRALDSRTGRLQPKPIVDPREPGEAMNGNPLTRAVSPDGRWAYTPYDGTEHPFIHALDTANRSARCIDLDWLHGRKDLWGMRFGVNRRRA